MNDSALLKQVENAPLYKLTGPPEHWLTTYNTGFWGLTDHYRNNLSALAPGNLFLFHSTDSEYVKDSTSGVIGIGVLSHIDRKDSLEWIGEIKDEENGWPNLTHFEEVWWFGRTEAVVDEPIRKKMNNPSKLRREIAALADRRITFSQMRDAGCPIGAQGSLARVNNQERFVQLIRSRLAEGVLYEAAESGATASGQLTSETDDGQDNGALKDVATGTRRTEREVRIGQRKFSENVRDNYHHQCCFPDCSVTTRTYLIGAHIDRWADNEEGRGKIANGLCLCLMHDKAFERGFFALNDQFEVITTEGKAMSSPWTEEHVLPYLGRQIRLGSVEPSVEAVATHRERNGFVSD